MEYNGPEQFKPLTMWNYFFLQILYGVPVVGIIFLIIHAISNGNINRRNFARSYFCVLVIAVVFFLIAALTGGLSDMLAQFANSFNG